MLKAGDNQITLTEKAAHTSEINFLTVGEVPGPEARFQMEVNNHIGRTHDAIISIVERLAAYYPNGYQGVLDSMALGPAHEHISALINPNANTFA